MTTFLIRFYSILQAYPYNLLMQSVILYVLQLIFNSSIISLFLFVYLSETLAANLKKTFSTASAILSYSGIFQSSETYPSTVLQKVYLTILKDFIFRK